MLCVSFLFLGSVLCTPPTIFDKEAIQSIPRYYIIEQLQDVGLEDVAAELKLASNPEHPIHQAFRAVAAHLNKEREEQFNDMLYKLSLDEDCLKEAYDTIISEVLKGPTHWGKMVTVVVFTSHVVLYCARSPRQNLKAKVPEIVAWADNMMQERLHLLIEEQGGWQAFVEHFDLENRRISLSTLLLGVGVVVTVLAGGLFALRRF